jgi:hypothetical protein
MSGSCVAEKMDEAAMKRKVTIQVTLPHLPVSSPSNSWESVKECKKRSNIMVTIQPSLRSPPLVKEVEDNTNRVQKMRDEGRDPYDIKKQVSILPPLVP